LYKSPKLIIFIKMQINTIIQIGTHLSSIEHILLAIIIVMSCQSIKNRMRKCVDNFINVDSIRHVYL